MALLSTARVVMCVTVIAVTYGNSNYKQYPFKNNVSEIIFRGSRLLWVLVTFSFVGNFSIICCKQLICRKRSVVVWMIWLHDMTIIYYTLKTSAYCSLPVVTYRWIISCSSCIIAVLQHSRLWIIRVFLVSLVTK